MFDIAYSYIVDQIFLIDALLSYDLNKIRSNPDRYSWVIDTLDSIRIFVSTHGGY